MFIVTGSNGFIGWNLATSLFRSGRTGLVSVDEYPSIEHLPDGGPEPPQEVRGPCPGTVRFIDKSRLVGWLERASGVRCLYHLGADSSTIASDVDYMMSNNTAYTEKLWRWCAEQEVPFIYASSAATYGDGRRGFDDESNPEIFTPLNLYGQSKHRFDLWALEQEAKGEPTPPRWVGLKYFNVYGPHEAHKGRMASMAYHWYRQILHGGEARLFKSYRPGVADGEQRRDFIHVDDAVAVTRHFGETTATCDAPNGLYNVGTGGARTFQSLAEAVFAALGIESKIVFVDMPEDLRGQYQYFTQATTAKLRRAGFDRPFIGLEEGIERYVAFLRSQECP